VCGVGKNTKKKSTKNTMSFEPVMPPYGASDPTARFLGASCWDFFLIEMVPMAYRVTNELEDHAVAAAAAAGDSTGDLKIAAAAASGEQQQQDGPEGGSEDQQQTHQGKGRRPLSELSSGGSGGGSRKMDEDEERDAVWFRLESQGYRVGVALVER